MTVFSWFKKKPPAEAAPPPPAPDKPQAPETSTGLPVELDRLVRVGLPKGAPLDEALVTLQGLRTSPREGRVLDELVRRHSQSPLPEPVAVAAAAALVDRGEPATAERLLEEATTSAALVLSADLAATSGDLAKAVARIERVLLRDLDHPGARERHLRWRGELGYGDGRRDVSAGATTMVARESDAPFDLLREVARGGAGAVYEATDRDLGRKVALKVYHQAERDRSQLSHEGQVAVLLSGPGVVRVYDIDPDHGWIALEWARLGAIRDLLRSGAHAALFPVEGWVYALAAALARVHAAGWVHHDVKPANVLLVDEATPVLTDFGIARKIGEPSPAGSMGYISPERMKGRPSDPRDDVYGFGRLLEDVLDVADPTTVGRMRGLASACTGPDAQRPPDARALVTRLRVELGQGPTSQRPPAP